MHRALACILFRHLDQIFLDLLAHGEEPLLALGTIISFSLFKAVFRSALKIPATVLWSSVVLDTHCFRNVALATFPAATEY